MPANTSPTFAVGDGKLATELGSTNDRGFSVVRQSDGKIIVAGHTDTGGNLDFALVRYNADGTLDTSFGTDGKVITALGSGDDIARSVVVQSDGRIVVAGAAGNGGTSDFAVVRYNNDGSLDTTFGGDGIVTTDFGDTGDHASEVALQSDGRIVLGGTSVEAVNGAFALARYNVDGTLDTSFDTDGRVTTDLTPHLDGASSIALQADGRIVAVGSAFLLSDVAVVRYDTNGALDATFDGDGSLLIKPSLSAPTATDVLVSGTKIVVTGFDQSDHHNLFVLRREGNGSPDTSLDMDGQVFSDLGGRESVYGIARMADGRLVVAGSIMDSAGTTRLMLLRYTALGALDATFDLDGSVTTAVRANSEGRGLVVQADGRILVAGWTAEGGDSDFALVRYNVDGSLDRTFGPPVNTLDGAPGYTTGAAPVVLDADAHVFDAELAAQGRYSGASVTLTRHGGASVEDIYAATGALGTLTQGAALVYGGVTVGTVTTNSAGVLVLTFNNNATQARVDGVLQSIAYSNINPAPRSVEIDWTFSDGNVGGQGTGGTLTATGSTTVAINANDAPTFVVGGGTVVTNFSSGSNEGGRSLALQEDGKIVVAADMASGGFTVALMRYNPDGTLDESFSGDGKTSVAFLDHAEAVALQPDGKIIVVGITNASDDFALARLNADGSLDTAFDGDGIVTTGFSPGSSDSATGIVVQPDGKLVVAGSSSNGFAVARYNLDGSLDTTFDADGKVTTFLGSASFASSVGRQSDGKLVVAGSAAHDLAVARYTANGSLDTTFSTDGKLVVDAFGGSADAVRALAIQPDGKILLAGYTSDGSTGTFLTQFMVVRLNADGTFDTSFDGDGKVTTLVGTGHAFASDIALQADGRILVVGRSDRGAAHADFTILRYNVDGSLDATFGGDGEVTTDFGSNESAAAVAVQADGRIVVTGDTTAGGLGTDVAIARYNGDGTLDIHFGPPNDTLNATPTFIENGTPIVLDSDVRIFDPELAAQGHYAGASLRLERHGGASAQDVFSATGLLGPLSGGNALTYDGVTIGTVTANSDGTLALVFNASATQMRVDGTLQSIAYSNTSDAPPDPVRIDWTFSDGNTDAQGSGGAQTALGSITVDISRRSDEYLWSSLTDEQVLEFDPEIDVLRFDDTSISAAAVSVSASSSSSMSVSYGGKTITVQASLTSVSSFHYTFDDHSWLIVGDNHPSDQFDNLGISLSGHAGDDQLIGLGGADTMRGGPGNDVYDVDDAGDRALENAGEGTDSVRSTITYTLGANLENLTLIGSASIDGVGNALANVLIGNGAANTLRGREGADTMSGRNGNDIYYVDNAGDRTIEGANSGTDTVFSTLNHTLADHVENLTFTTILAITGIGNDLDNKINGSNVANVLEGRGGNDRLDGLAGADTLIGGTGDDSYLLDEAGDAVIENAGEGIDTVQTALAYGLGANVENLSLTGAASVDGRGNELANVLTGNSAANTLDGREGADTMSGGAGDDIYYVDHADDRAIEKANEGTDTVFSAVSHTLGVHVENLTFTTVLAVTGIGNDVGNSISGSGVANVLEGRGGNDRLDGRAGGDTLIGGAGDDMYLVDEAGDLVTELANEGTDGVQSWISYTLGANVENLALVGIAAIDGRGNALANVLTGNHADNRLTGGLGADVLTGGGGSDVFDYDAANEGGDTIVGFTPGASNDAIDVRDLLVGYQEGSSNVEDFIRLTEGYGHTVLSVNADGVDGDFVQLATLRGVAHLVLDDMIAQGNLVVA